MFINKCPVCSETLKCEDDGSVSCLKGHYKQWYEKGEKETIGDVTYNINEECKDQQAFWKKREEQIEKVKNERNS